MMPGILLIAGLLARVISPVGPVVSVAWLNQHLHDRNLVIVALDRGPDYAAGHIAGARLLGRPGLERNSMGSGASMDMSSLPEIAEVRGKLETLGISSESQVVVVFAGIAVTAATRVILLMKHAGVENVALLDGGAEAWKKSGLPVTAEVPKPVPGHLTGTGPADVGIDAVWVQAHLNSPHIRLIDARDAVYYEGAASPDMGMSAGHIPGAKNVPFGSLFDSAGVMLNTAAIEAKFRAAGVQSGDTVIAYCHVGIQATTVVLAARIINQPVKMYIGSFHDWSARKLPTEGGKP